MTIMSHGLLIKSLVVELPLEIPSNLVFTIDGEMQCFRVSLNSGTIGIIEGNFSTIDITITSNPQNNVTVEITLDTTTISIRRGMFEGEVTLNFPQSVAVSEGSPVVVCFSAELVGFSDPSIRVILSLGVQDISTSKCINYQGIFGISFLCLFFFLFLFVYCSLSFQQCNFV